MDLLWNFSIRSIFSFWISTCIPCYEVLKITCMWVIKEEFYLKLCVLYGQAKTAMFFYSFLCAVLVPKILRKDLGNRLRFQWGYHALRQGGYLSTSIRVPAAGICEAKGNPLAAIKLVILFTSLIRK